MKYTIILIFSFFLNFELKAQISEIENSKHPIDTMFMNCQNGKICYCGSTSSCATPAIEEWDAYLNKYYNLLLKKINNKTNKENLINAQIAWIKYKDAEFKNSKGLIYGEGDTGSFHPALVALNHLLFIRARALELEAYYNNYQLKMTNY